MSDCCPPIVPDTVTVTLAGVSHPLVYHFCGEFAGYWVGTVDGRLVQFRFTELPAGPVEKTDPKV